MPGRDRVEHGGRHDPPLPLARNDPCDGGLRTRVLLGHFRAHLHGGWERNGGAGGASVAGAILKQTLDRFSRAIFSLLVVSGVLPDRAHCPIRYSFTIWKLWKPLLVLGVPRVRAGHPSTSEFVGCPTLFWTVRLSAFPFQSA